jgi:hypothetical protein
VSKYKSDLQRLRLARNGYRDAVNSLEIAINTARTNLKDGLSNAGYSKPTNDSDSEATEDF